MPKAIGIEAEDAGRYVRVGFGPGEVGQPCERAVCKNQQLGEMYTVNDIWIPLVHEQQQQQQQQQQRRRRVICHLSLLRQ